MTQYGIDTIIKDVRVAMDENTATTAFVDDAGDTVDPDTLEMEEIIRSKVADGLNAVRMVAALGVLELKRVEPEVSWIDEAKGIGKVSLPDDYLRLGLLKMSDWQYGVGEAISPVSDTYRQQWSEYAGVRGNPYNPVVAVSADIGTGHGALEFFSCDSTEATAELLYVAREAGDEEKDAYDIEQGLYRAVVLKVASLVAATLGNADAKAVLEAMSGEQVNA